MPIVCDAFGEFVEDRAEGCRRCPGRGATVHSARCRWPRHRQRMKESADRGPEHVQQRHVERRPRGHGPRRATSVRPARRTARGRRRTIRSGPAKRMLPLDVPIVVVGVMMAPSRYRPPRSVDEFGGMSGAVRRVGAQPDDDPPGDGAARLLQQGVDHVMVDDVDQRDVAGCDGFSRASPPTPRRVRVARRPWTRCGSTPWCGSSRRAARPKEPVPSGRVPTR